MAPASSHPVGPRAALDRGKKVPDKCPTPALQHPKYGRSRCRKIVEQLEKVTTVSETKYDVKWRWAGREAQENERGRRESQIEWSEEDQDRAGQAIDSAKQVQDGIKRLETNILGG